MTTESEIEAGIMAALHVSRDTVVDILDAAKKARESTAVAWLREVDSGTDCACWVVCAKGDPGSQPVFLDE